MIDDVPAPTQTHCIKCGTEVPAVAKFCPTCGSTVYRRGNDSQRSAAASAVPPMTEVTQNQERFKDFKQLTNRVKRLLYAYLAVTIFSIMSGLIAIGLVSQLQAGELVEDSVIDFSDNLEGIIALLLFLVTLISVFFYLKWVYRANCNVRELGAKGMNFTPGWSIAWYFVPLAWWWKPYQAMKELWKTSHAPDNWREVTTGSLLPMWWFFYLASTILSGIYGRIPDQEIDDILNGLITYLASDLVSIPLVLITLALVDGIYKAQWKHHRLQHSHEAGPHQP